MTDRDTALTEPRSLSERLRENCNCEGCVCREAADRIDALEAAVAELRALHSKRLANGYYDCCQVCALVDYPCPTIRILDRLDSAK